MSDLLLRIIRSIIYRWNLEQSVLSFLLKQSKNHSDESRKQEALFNYIKQTVQDNTIRKDLLLDLLIEVADKNRKTSQMPQLTALSNDFVGYSIIANGYHEKELLEFLGEKVYPKLKKGIALDIGAFIGTHSVHMAKYFNSVISFEPNPVVYKLLEANVADSASKNIFTYNFGLSGEEQVLTYYKYKDGNLGRNKFVPAGELVEDTFVKVGDLIVKSGEAAFKQISSERNISLPISLIKIDTEGHEISVLNGLKSVLTEHQPVILFESLGIKDTTRIIEHLKSLGYSVFIEFNEHNPINPSRITTVQEKFYALILASAYDIAIE